MGGVNLFLKKKKKFVLNQYRQCLRDENWKSAFLLMKQHIFGNFLHIWFKHENLTSPNTPSTPITSWDLCAAVLKMTKPKTTQAAPREPMSNKYSHNYWARPPVSWDHHGKNRRNLSHIFNIIKCRQHADFRELYQDIKVWNAGETSCELHQTERNTHGSNLRAGAAASLKHFSAQT